MDTLLLGQNKGWEDLIIPMVVGAIYLFAHLLKGATAEKKGRRSENNNLHIFPNPPIVKKHRTY